MLGKILTVKENKGYAIIEYSDGTLLYLLPPGSPIKEGTNVSFELDNTNPSYPKAIKVEVV